MKIWSIGTFEVFKKREKDHFWYIFWVNKVDYNILTIIQGRFLWDWQNHHPFGLGRHLHHPHRVGAAKFIMSLRLVFEEFGWLYTMFHRDFLGGAWGLHGVSCFGCSGLGVSGEKNHDFSGAARSRKLGFSRARAIQASLGTYYWNQRIFFPLVLLFKEKYMILRQSNRFGKAPQKAEKTRDAERTELLVVPLPCSGLQALAEAPGHQLLPAVIHGKQTSDERSTSLRLEVASA